MLSKLYVLQDSDNWNLYKNIFYLPENTFCCHSNIDPEINDPTIPPINMYDSTSEKYPTANKKIKIQEYKELKCLVIFEQLKIKYRICP